MNTTLDASREPVIVAAVRTPVGKAKRGKLATTRPEYMATEVIRALLQRAENIDPHLIDDLVLGCAFPEGEQGMNMARLIGFRSQLPTETPAETINRFCSSGVQSIAHAAYAIMAGQAQIIIAGGVESMSMVPMTGYKFSPDDQLASQYPEAFTSMGLTAENVAEQYRVSREDQDQFSLISHQRATEAVQSGRFDPEIVPLDVKLVTPDGNNEYTFKRDEGPRPDTSLEALSKLRPVFKEGGTVTAGNSSQMSDGAAAVLIMSRQRAEDLGLDPMARFVAFTAAGVPPDIMGIGPTKAVPKVLELTGMNLEDIELIELNEAFASQSLAVIRELDLDMEITNVNGGAIALGHPLGCTGTKLTIQLLYEMERRDLEVGMVTMCIGGGMGAAAIFKRN